MSPVRLVVVGDALLDRDLEGTVERLCPDAPVPVVDAPVARSRPGGAGLAAALAAADGTEVVLVTALAPDAAGAELAAALERCGVRVVDLGLDGRTPEKVRVRAAGQSLLRLDHGGGPGRVGCVTEEADDELRGAATVLVADYGRGVAAEASVRRAIADLPGRTPVVWDPHPRGPEPVPGVRLATPNAGEAARLVPDVPEGMRGTAAAAHRARALVARWRAGAVAVTMSAEGAMVAIAGGTPLMVPAPPASGDACGAGDRFAATAAVCLAAGAVVSEAVEEAVRRASAFVAAGGAAGAALPVDDEPATGGDGASPPRRVPLRVQAPGAADGDGDGHGDGDGDRRRDGDRHEPIARVVPRREGPSARNSSDGAGGDGIARDLPPERWSGARNRFEGDGDAPGDESAAAAVMADDGVALAATVRAGGGIVVATGGCFDLLHAGHVGMLQAARRLGDCLVVCLNSDASVRRLKGPDRPLQPAADRAAVLLALDCVDAVHVFDEDTPAEALARIRPHLFAKGGDYAIAELPEAETLARWGGQAVALPYLPGRSTTRLLEEAVRRAP